MLQAYRQIWLQMVTCISLKPDIKFFFSHKITSHPSYYSLINPTTLINKMCRKWYKKHRDVDTDIPTKHLHMKKRYKQLGKYRYI